MSGERANEPTLANLVGGIVADVQELIRKQIALAKQEIHEDVIQAKESVIAALIAVGVLGLGAILLVVMLSQALADSLDWPGWAGYGVMGLLLSIAGLVLLSAVKNKNKELKPGPEKTMETLKENVAWIKNRTVSDRT